jgi:hypothetical protein
MSPYRRNRYPAGKALPAQLATGDRSLRVTNNKSRRAIIKIHVILGRDQVLGGRPAWLVAGGAALACMQHLAGP